MKRIDKKKISLHLITLIATIIISVNIFAWPSGYTTTFISTPNGSSVEVVDYTGDLTTSEINSANRVSDRYFPSAIIRRQLK